MNELKKTLCWYLNLERVFVLNPQDLLLTISLNIAETTQTALPANPRINYSIKELVFILGSLKFQSLVHTSSGQSVLWNFGFLTIRTFIRIGLYGMACHPSTGLRQSNYHSLLINQFGSIAYFKCLNKLQWNRLTMNKHHLGHNQPITVLLHHFKTNWLFWCWNLFVEKFSGKEASRIIQHRIIKGTWEN